MAINTAYGHPFLQSQNWRQDQSQYLTYQKNLLFTLRYIYLLLNDISND